MSDRLALLERAQQGDDRAEAQLLTENAGLIWSIVRRYNGCGVETDDLYQLGCIGFVKAVKGFDLTYGTQFSTYAVPKIAGEIRRFLRDDGPVKVGRTMREKGQTLWAARERLQGRLGCPPKVSQLAAETGMTPEEIAGAYEKNTGLVIIETFESWDTLDMPAVLVSSHGPFTWGKDPMESVHNSAVLEIVAQMAHNAEQIRQAPSMPSMQAELLKKHFERKHGANAYYGQKK